MHENEVGNFFSYESTHFESAGVFIDCDVYSSVPMDASEVTKSIKNATRLAWTKADNYFAKLGY